MRHSAIPLVLACALVLGAAGSEGTPRTDKMLARVSGRLPIGSGTGALVVEGAAYTVALDGGEMVLRPLDKAVRDEIRVPLPRGVAAGALCDHKGQLAGRVEHSARPAGICPPPTGEASFDWSSVEFPLDTVPVVLKPDRHQMMPAVAFDGTNYLLVWEDWRGDGDIYCSRVSADGAMLDPGGIPVAALAGYQLAPAVAFDGTDFIVVWEDWRREYCSDIYGARISTSGEVLDPGGRPVCGARDDQWNPAIAANGAQCLVVWEDYRTGVRMDIYGTRLGSGLSVADPSGLVISAAYENDNAPDVTAGTDGWLVTWARWWSILDSSDIYQAQVGTDGNVNQRHGAPATAATGVQYGCHTAFDGTNYLVAWSDHRNGDADVYACRLSGSGSRLDPTDIAVSRQSEGQWVTGVGHNGTDFVVVCDDERSGMSDVYAVLVSGSGVVTDSSGIAVCTAADDQFMSALDTRGPNALLVWADFRSDDRAAVYGARLSASGSVLDPDGRALTGITNRQRRPAVACGSNGYLAVWEDCRNGDLDIYACRYRADGTLLDPVPFAVADGDSDQAEPVVAFDGTNYLVLWTKHGSRYAPDVVGVRVSSAGVVLDTIPIEVAADRGEQFAAAVAFNGTDYLVAWQDDRASSNWDNISACRLTTGGVIRDTLGIAVSTAINWQVAPSVAATGTEFLVAWEDHRAGVQGDIYACRVTADGVVLDTFGVAVSILPSDQSAPDVASNGTSFLLVWQDERLGRSAIYGSRFSSGVLDPGGRKVYSGWHDQASPAVCWDGTNYLASWTGGLGVARSVMAGRIGGGVTLTGLYWVGEQVCAEIEPDLCGSGGDVSVVFSGWTGSCAGICYNQHRVWAARCIDAEPNVEPGWTRLPDVPATWRQVKHGGGLTGIGDKIYVVVGNRTREFHEYDISSRTWRRLPDVPGGPLSRPVKTGGCVTNDGYSVFLLKGNRTYEFYRYDPLTETWFDMPKPVLIKKIKGASMAFDGERSIYMIPGDRLREWKKFDVFDELWGTPDPESLPTPKWKRGSCIAVAGDKLYGLRRGYKSFNEFYELNVRYPGSPWIRLEDMPLYNEFGRRKKVKDGAGIAWDGQKLYALKGGKTNEFYSFDPSDGSWTRMLNVGAPNSEPRKRVKQGGGIIYSPYAGGFFVLCGNKTNEFWFYMPGAEGSGDGPQAGATRLVPEKTPLVVTPNPTAGPALLKCPGFSGSPAEARFYDPTGRLAYRAPFERGTCLLPAGTLPAGVYLVRVGDDKQMAETKIVVTQ